MIADWLACRLHRIAIIARFEILYDDAHSSGIAIIEQKKTR